MSEQPPPRRRPNPSALDLVRALAPLVVLILVVGWLSTPSDPDPVREIDPAGDLTYAATLADFDVLAAAELAQDWRATSARVDPAVDGGPVVVRVGYVTPEGEFAEVAQGSVPAETLLTEVLGEGYTEADRVDVEGVPWRLAKAANGEQAFVRNDEASTVVVTGSADDDELRALIAALRPVSG